MSLSVEDFDFCDGASISLSRDNLALISFRNYDRGSLPTLLYVIAPTFEFFSPEIAGHAKCHITTQAVIQHYVRTREYALGRFVFVTDVASFAFDGGCRLVRGAFLDLPQGPVGHGT